MKPKHEVYAPHNDLWHSGPNFAADPVVIALGEVLLIRRGDNGLWALPGGFRNEISKPDPDPTSPPDANLEPADQAAARELCEETGVEVSPGDAIWLGHLVCQDPRNTECAWIETDGHLWTLAEKPPVKAGDDAKDAAWFKLAELPRGMMSHHLQLIDKAKEKL